MRVHIICWDGVEYDREASEDELNDYNAKGLVAYSDYELPIINFDINGKHQ